MQFSHLHVHTQFSLLDGAASIKNLYKKAIEDKMPALAIIDHGNMFGAFEFVKEAYNHKNADGRACAGGARAPDRRRRPDQAQPHHPTTADGRWRAPVGRADCQ